MNLFDAIAGRYSVRAYQDKAIEREKLESIFDAVRLAPSARNAQEWRFIVVTDAELRAKVAAAGGQPFLRECPAIIAACAETDRRPMRCGELAYPIDLAIAIDHLTLAATAMGLGTCWIGSFDAPAVRSVLGIPDEVPVVELVAIGYPADRAPAPANRRRLALDEILMENGWRQPWRD
jgi:nitroreductase